MSCLLDLAATGQLPDHQFMDRRTLDWIESHEEVLFTGEAAYPDQMALTEPSIQAAIEQFTPPADWYLSPALTDSIHGVRHTLRVIALACLISTPEITNEPFTKQTSLAASLHDLRRLHDRHDLNHGLRAARWWLENEQSVSRTFHLAHPDTSAVFHAIRLHDIPYEQFSIADRDEYANHRRLVDTLRLADALDRYRLPKAKWWIDDRKLALTASVPLKHLAFRLAIQSERRFLEGLESAEAVRSAVRCLFPSVT